MKQITKTITTVLIGIVIGVAATQLTELRLVNTAIDYLFGLPHVTLINVTGNDISQVTITLGTVKQQVPNLKDQQTITVPITGRFGECSTQISWTDSMGKHNESADDYMESYGIYHAHVVLTPERKVKAIYEMLK